MLVDFTFKNWTSFRDEVTFSMVATEEQAHADRVPHVSKYDMRLLPIAAIYGGNASGKTNLFKALSFAKDFIVDYLPRGSPINVERFLLDDRSLDQPSTFCFRLLIDEEIYAFSFTLTHRKVIEERFGRICEKGDEKVLYHRHRGKPHLDPSLEKEKFLDFVFQGTRENQLFLNNLVDQRADEVLKRKEFVSVYSWFRQSLQCIAPDSHFEKFEKLADQKHLNTALAKLDLGITRLDFIPPDKIPPLPEGITREIGEGEGLRFWGEKHRRFIVFRKQGKVMIGELIAYHKKKDGGEIRFESAWESDGTHRVIDLLPALISLSRQAQSAKDGQGQVCIVDEVDRSLHTLLTRELIGIYLASCSSSTRTQLLLTTHDPLLLDLDRFRRDEIWLCERDREEVSRLFSVSDYRNEGSEAEKLIERYLQGRMGGIPQVLSGNAIANYIRERK